MVNVSRQTESAFTEQSRSHLHLIYDCQRAAGQPAPADAHPEADLVWGTRRQKQPTVFKARKTQAGVFAAEQGRLEGPGLLTIRDPSGVISGSGLGRKAEPNESQLE